MSAVEVTISGVLFDKTARTTRPVVLIGEATLTGFGVGGGPVYPPEAGSPPGMWGPGDPRPNPPIANVPGLPPMPDEPPVGSPDGDGFIKPPPAGGGWAYHQTYGWMLDPPPGSAAPK